MVHTIFYAMIMNTVAKLGLASKLSIKCIMWVMQKLDSAPIKFWLENIDCRLRRAQASWPANPPPDTTSLGGPVEDSCLTDAPPVSSDEE